MAQSSGSSSEKREEMNHLVVKEEGPSLSKLGPLELSDIACTEYHTGLWM